jgi:hypothetical protein
MVCIPLTQQVLADTRIVLEHVKWRAAKRVGPEPDLSKIPPRFQLFADNVPDIFAPWIAKTHVVTLALYLCGGERPHCMPSTTETDAEASAELFKRRELAKGGNQGGGYGGGKGPRR